MRGKRSIDHVLTLSRLRSRHLCSAALSHPNLIGQAHHGSGKVSERTKRTTDCSQCAQVAPTNLLSLLLPLLLCCPLSQTAAFSLGVLSRVDLSKRVPQIIVLCPTRELAIQVTDVLKTLAQYTTVDIFTAVPTNDRGAGGAFGGGAKPRGEKINAQIVVGTPGTVDSKIAHRDLDVRNIIMFVADEADQMIAQEGLGDKTVQIKKKLPKSAQILLFSATFDEATRKFAKVVAPQAVEIMVKTEELSLDGIKQYYM